VCLLFEVRAGNMVRLYNGDKAILYDIWAETEEKPYDIDMTIKYDVVLNSEFKSTVINCKSFCYDKQKP
jgi:hypothetical protein